MSTPSGTSGPTTAREGGSGTPSATAAALLRRLFDGDSGSAAADPAPRLADVRRANVPAGDGSPASHVRHDEGPDRRVDVGALTNREVEAIVDRVVARIEQRVVDELERRGRRYRGGAY